MNSPLGQMVECMLLTACRDAERVPTPQNPPDAAWELDADEYCLRFARTRNPERMNDRGQAVLPAQSVIFRKNDKKWFLPLNGDPVHTDISVTSGSGILGL